MTELTSADQQLLDIFASGQLGNAFQLAAQRVQQDANALIPWRVLAHIRLFQGMLHEAAHCVQQALTIDPHDAESLLLSASILGAGGRTGEAIARCDELLALDPASVEAMTTKARFMERAGDAEGAIALVDQLDTAANVAADIVSARGLLRLDRPEEALKVLDGTLAREGVAERRQYNIQMLRARALDTLGRFDDAFAAAAAGNASVAAENYDPAAYGAMVDGLIETFSEEKIASLAKNASSAAPHVFICGFPRSGTTLVEQILDAHPGAVGVGEAKEIDIATRSLQQHTGAFVGYPHCAEFIEEPLLQQLAAAYEQAMVAHGHPAGAVYVNKNLQNLLHAGLIAMLFPQSKIVFTQRDPRDTAVSCFMGAFRAEAMPHLFSMEHIAASLGHAARLTEHWQRVLPVPTHTVRYEDMVADHDAQTRALVDFAGLPWDDRCLRFFDSGRTVMTLAYDQVSRPIYHSSVGRYKNYEAHLGPVASLSGTE